LNNNTFKHVAKISLKSEKTHHEKIAKGSGFT